MLIPSDEFREINEFPECQKNMSTKDRKSLPSWLVLSSIDRHFMSANAVHISYCLSMKTKHLANAVKAPSNDQPTATHTEGETVG